MNINDLQDDKEEQVYMDAFTAAPVGSENDAAEAAVMEHRSKTLKNKKDKPKNMFKKRQDSIDKFF